jgi:hypothetical protein
MYIVQNNSPGQFINLDHVAVMDWDKGLSTEFIMANGQTITWTYDNVDEQMEDLQTVSRILYDTDMLISVELDQE